MAARVAIRIRYLYGMGVRPQWSITFTLFYISTRFIMSNSTQAWEIGQINQKFSYNFSLIIEY